MFPFAALFGSSFQTCRTGLDDECCPYAPLPLSAPLCCPAQMLRNTLAQVVGAEARQEEEAILQVTHPLNVCSWH
jgi:hypothetical protein